jgi:hypothetical protein
LAARFFWLGVFGSMFWLVKVAVSDVVVVIVAEGVAVSVPMVVDEQRLTADPQQAAAKGGGEMLGSQHLVGGAVGNHTASEQHHTTGPLGLFEMVCREHHGGSRCDLGVDDRQNGFLARQVEAGDGLIEQQQPGRSNQCLRNQDPLALTTREFAERPPEQIAHLEPFGDCVDLGPIGTSDSTQQSTRSIAAHPNHFVDRQWHPIVVLVLLRDKSGLDAWCPLDRSGSWFQEARQETQDRALAAAVRSNECHRGRRAEPCAGGIERDDIGVSHGHRGQFDDRRVACHSDKS